MPLPTRLKTPPTDLASLLAFCKAGVADWSLSGGVWRSAKAWKAKVPVLARVFDEVFESVVREGKTEAYDQAWLDVARAVGGVETYAMSQRAELEGGEECESWKSWMCFIGTGSGMEEGEGAEEERRVTAERRRELVRSFFFALSGRRWLMIGTRAQGLVEVGKGEYASALREFGVAVLLNPEDGRLYDDLCLARASIAGDHQCVLLFLSSFTRVGADFLARAQVARDHRRRLAGDGRVPAVVAGRQVALHPCWSSRRARERCCCWRGCVRFLSLSERVR